ncbi:FACT complex subunit pob3 [Lineolata rhizophorae]|uniref:FACT complex subunit POB3 n=1 Tax=Lineolata rhizophorae TaxID=578093 RepID=A0A6A6PC63_9PEZI|nr:FACT complex subunit pob3 [Lineolata rhizophorae]
MEAFENIHLDLSKAAGKCRFAETGLGWRPAGHQETWTLDGRDIRQAQWSRAARGYEVKIYTRAGAVIQLDGFQHEDFDRLSKVFKIWYSVNLEHREHALRGWNWGKAEFGKAELAFNVQSRPAFEIPYSEVSNTNLAGKNEVSVEFSTAQEQPDKANTAGNIDLNQKKRGKKTTVAADQLVEMRFYIPGTALSKKEKKVKEEEEMADISDEDKNGAENGEGEEENAAHLFYNTLLDKAEIGDVAGESIATFPDILHLTPRGRFEIDMYENSFRLRGKTYDYKIQYDSMKKFLLLPKPDDVHTLITIGLDPPLRQGQTRYPFLVMQFKRDEEVSIELNLKDEVIQEKYNGKLQKVYEAPISNVIAQIFRGLAGKRISTPSKDFMSHHGESGVKCSIKANEGHLFCMEKSFMFVPKPATYISFDNIQNITMSRVGGAVSASRTFDITITLKGGQGEHQFSNINREEQKSLEDFFRTKGIKTKNEIDDSGTLLAAALQDEDLASSEEEVIAAARGSADEDDESIDEDFQADSESEVAEEFDSAHESSGSASGSDVEMDDAEGDAESDVQEVVERPKKKAKTGK